tara:strand:+ start:2483 stop:4687 length:2205 start_codon:yes stop_codon:yes gene_type:complete
MIKKIILTNFILFSFFISGNIEIYSEIIVNKPDDTTIEKLRKSVHIDHLHRLYNGDIQFVVSASDMKIINSLEIDYDIIIEDLESFYLSRLTDNYTREFGLGSMGGYYTFDEIVNNLDLVFSECSDIISQKVSIGQTYEGREIWAIKFSDNPNIDEDEAEVLYTGLHHSREPMSYMNLFYYMYWLCDNYGIDDLATKIINNRELWFIPAINPDGLVYNQTIAPGGGGMQRKNMRETCSSTPTGVDLNRNYDFMWALDDQGSSGDGCNETYRGSSAFSEPETRAVRDFTNEHDFPIAFNYHSYSNLMIYPYGFDYENTVPQEDLQTFIDYGQDMVQFNGYALGTGTDLLYPVNGEACDWMYGEHQIFAYTPEIGSQQDGFWPATDRIVPLAEDNLYPNQFIAIHAGANIKSELITNASDSYLQGNSYPLSISLNNVGLSESQSTTYLSIQSDQLNIEIDDIVISSIDGRSSIDFGVVGDFTIPITFPSGGEITIDLIVQNDQEFTSNSSLTFLVGEPSVIISDSFNTNDYLDWVFAGDSDWRISNEFFNSPSSSISSGAIENNQQSSLILNVDMPSAGSLEFFYKVSSEYSPSGENFYDGLTFFVDGQEFGKFQPESDGSSPWNVFSSDLSIGSHELMWTYSKDGGGGSTDCSNSGCYDAAFIDDLKIFAYLDSNLLIGDLNQDLSLNILDVVVLVNYVLGIDSPSNDDFILSDINGDNALNVIDIVNLVNLILS